MPYVDIGAVADFPAGRGTAVVAGGRRLAVFPVDERIYVVDDLCPHRRFPLNDGIVQGLTVRCRTHGSCFALDSGERLRGPARRGIRAYPVEIVASRVRVDVHD